MAVNSMAGASWGVAQYAMQARKTTDTKSAAQNQTTQAQSEQTKRIRAESFAGGKASGSAIERYSRRGSGRKRG